MQLGIKRVPVGEGIQFSFTEIPSPHRLVLTRHKLVPGWPDVLLAWIYELTVSTTV